MFAFTSVLPSEVQVYLKKMYKLVYVLSMHTIILESGLVKAMLLKAGTSFHYASFVIQSGNNEDNATYFRFFLLIFLVFFFF